MHVDLQTENVAKLIQLALGPVFLISGVGITLSMLTQRLARIVDRARKLEAQREDHQQREEARAHRRGPAGSSFDARATSTRAIALSTTSALLTTLVVTLLFASEFMPLSVGGAIAVMFVASMVCLSTAFLMFLLEVRIATNSLRIGVHKND